MIYLGTLGQLVALKCPSSQQVQHADRVTTATTLEGRVKAQLRPVGRRVWSVSVSEATTPADQATILSFATGEWGPGPFVFVGADAPITNLLSPPAAACLETLFPATTVQGGPVNLGADGWAGSSLTTPVAAPGGMYFGGSAELVPALPGQPVTGAAWLQGTGAQIRINWYDASRTYMGQSASSAQTATATMARLSVTAAPPAGAVACRLLATGPAGMRGTRPTVTWTDTLEPWGPGEGCPKAVIHNASKDVTMAVRGSNYSAMSYTITEVG